MIPFTLSKIAPVLNTKLVGNDVYIDTVIIDSRINTISHRCLFIALKGNQFDAHDFAKQAVAAGAVALVVSRPLSLEVPQLIVSDTRYALGKLGSWVRQHVPTQVVAITGSSGKTSVKEMTTAILRQCGLVLATEGNFNNDIGVPMTLLRLTAEHNYAVIELGANHLNEIAWTTNLVYPETALVTNISASHLSGFGSLSNVAKAKGEIFSGLPSNGIGIINYDSNDWHNWKQVLGDKEVWRFSVQEYDGVDFFSSDIKSDHKGVRFTLHSPHGLYPVRLQLLGRHNVANAIAASALAMSVGASLPAVAAGLSQLQSIPGRLFPISLGVGKILLDDSYNANISSMIVAIQVLSEMPGYQVMVVGDMAELGADEEEYHRQVGKAVALTGIDKVLSVGSLSNIIGKASGRSEHFKNKTMLIKRLIKLLSEYAVITILVKGSRIAKMDKVVQALQEQVSC